MEEVRDFEGSGPAVESGQRGGRYEVQAFRVETSQ